VIPDWENHWFRTCLEASDSGRRNGLRVVGKVCEVGISDVDFGEKVRALVF
jgi:hypothetical protein